ncbi:MAG: metallopeptidase family protein [Kiritimatiellae bacterium]|nr:metallopeptidase family protein [Kiritimatiellia bacterium]
MTGREKIQHNRRLLTAAKDEVADVLRRLPLDLAREVEKLTVSFEKAPDDDLTSAGIDPGVLALFEGESYAEEGTTSFPVPPRILLFLDNMWDEAGEDLDQFRQEVRTSYLHELGHYLGLDEEGLVERGLE